MSSTISPQHSISDVAARRRKDVERARRWHDQRRAERLPETRDVDAALAEALCFVVNIEAMSPPATAITVDLRSIADVAQLLLRERGFAAEGLRIRVLRRLKSRSIHRDKTRLINVAGVDDPRVVSQPRRGGEPWSSADMHLINRVTRNRSPNA